MEDNMEGNTNATWPSTQQLINGREHNLRFYRGCLAVFQDREAIIRSVDPSQITQEVMDEYSKGADRFLANDNTWDSGGVNDYLRRGLERNSLKANPESEWVIRKRALVMFLEDCITFLEELIEDTSDELEWLFERMQMQTALLFPGSGRPRHINSRYGRAPGAEGRDPSAMQGL
jgi:hypothetical protein